MSRRRNLAIAAACAGIAGAAVERFVFASPRYRGEPSNHFDGHRFHNSDHLWQSEGSFLKWQMNRERGYWPDWIEEAPGTPPQHRVGGDRVRVTLINHATLLIQMGNLNLLTDPIWSMRCSPLSFLGPRRHRPPGLDFNDLPPIDAVLVSHNHYDHLDIPTLWRLRVTHQPRVLTLLGNSALMARHGLRGASDLDWWDAVQIGDVRITAVPAHHFCARALSDRNATLWGGFVISSPAGNVYFAGDTGWGDHFARIAERFSPIRLAMLPIGAYLPRWFMRPAHIDPAEAVAAHRVLGARLSVPMHYGTFALGDDGERQPVDDLRRAIEAEGATGIEILEHGVGLEA